MTRSHATEYDARRDLRGYFGRIAEAGLLTVDDERSLAAAIACGDEDARTRLIASNLRLVVHIAGEYRDRGLPLDDLIGEGNLGLIKAAGRFDVDFGVRFGTYAAHWIKEAIRRALHETTSTIRLPVHLARRMADWRRAEGELARDLGRAPSLDEVADRLDLSPAQRTMMRQAFASRRTRLAGTPDDDEMWSLAAAPGRGAAPEAQAEGGEDLAGLGRRMEALNERERTVLTFRYGLHGCEPLNLRETGERMGVTREWARRLEVRAIGKLADAASAN